MGDLSLIKGLFIHPTPSGAYYAVSAKDTDISRQFLKALLKQQTSPQLNIENLQLLMQLEDEEKCLQLLHRCQKLGWVQGINKAINFPQQAMENIIPDMLKNITETGKALLADDQGFYLACIGFPHEVAEELSALSAEIAIVHERRSGVLMKNLGLASHAWAVVDATGNSQVGCWPLFIGKTRFVIAISGMPKFNQPDFVNLVWTLSIRYAKNTK